MAKGLEEGLHGLNTIRGRLPPKEGVQTNHRAKEGYRATKKRDMVGVGPIFNGARNWGVRSPKERRLGEGKGEPKVTREIIEPLKELGRLLKWPHNGDIVNVGRYGKIAEAL